MGRPSLAEQRKAEILDAFGRCVARFGLEGSSLERIAEEAGMRRSILRHYIGNRDELIEALAEKVITDYRSETQRMLEGLPASNRGKHLVNFLLPEKSMGTTEQLLVIEGLIGASATYPKVRKWVFGYIDYYVQLIADQLCILAPAAKPKTCWEAAYALVCISFNQESLQPLDLPKKYLVAARNSAKSVIKSLK